jgi:hypothetical protein
MEEREKVMKSWLLVIPWIVQLLAITPGFAQDVQVISMKPTADTMVRSDRPDKNYGDASYFGSDTSPEKYGYVRFDVQGISGQVVTATIRLLVKNRSRNAPKILLVEPNWQEYEVNFFNRPDFIGEPLDDLESTSSRSYVEYDVSQAVQENGVYNFGLLPDSNDDFSVESRESSTPPELIISFEGDTPDPVQPPPSDTEIVVIERRISSSSDDAEEAFNGEMDLDSSDLELTQEKSTQKVGIRFTDLHIPREAFITKSHIQFQADETDTDYTELLIVAELADNASAFEATDYNISDRLTQTTSQSVLWTPPTWDQTGEAGTKQRTPDLSQIIQEIVDGNGWLSGNAIAFFLTGTGKRVAESYDGVAQAAPNLHIEFEAPLDESPPDEPPPDESPEVTDTFACLNVADETELVTGFHDTKFDPDTAPGKAFDAREATFLIKYETHGIITVDGNSDETGMCWAGGYVYSDKPWDASWADHKGTDGPTRNSTVINNKSYEMIVTGMDFFNIHDGPRSSNAIRWKIQNVWGEYIRDDAIENDHFHSGIVYDSLFDGTYTGISTRPSSSSEDSDNGAGEVVTLEKVLIRLEAMPWPYKWESKDGNIDENGDPWTGEGIPYGHGSWFKYYDEDNDRGDRDTKNNHFVFKDVVLAAAHKNVGAEHFNLPAVALIDHCENITIAYLSDDGFVGHRSIDDAMEAFPGCITILEGQKARDFWKAKVTDWHKRHPEVGASRKPLNPGSTVFPKQF